ncbi:MAG: rod shape-determining protein MreD [Rhodobacteraceae bacterium]|nr:rod shape-determining protein MreD [Paracoccaceae bacterium]
MAKLTSARLWMMRCVYLGFAACIIFFHLLPLDTVARRWAPPDLLMAMTFAWALRQPDFVPAFLIAVVMLLADLLFQRPPGLVAALVVAGVEYLKNRLSGLSNASFVGEWTAVAIVITGIVAANRLILAIFSVNQAPLVLALFQVILTIAVYPIMAGFTHYILGVRKLVPGDADATGNRL